MHKVNEFECFWTMKLNLCQRAQDCRYLFIWNNSTNKSLGFEQKTKKQIQRLCVKNTVKWYDNMTITWPNGAISKCTICTLISTAIICERVLLNRSLFFFWYRFIYLHWFSRLVHNSMAHSFTVYLFWYVYVLLVFFFFVKKSSRKRTSSIDTHLVL